ncbi:hypothetical protein OZX69_00850 [Lactobacillus sp. ESL0731]|uniref:hypothetical protein n=1 Tax=unclassified Lactobacillus TaxID=2620435 RepID=UPI0023F73195|nr:MULTISPECIES: hypothetical protein [unclassified Lactobacillus]WEV51302.1 hypothetical protein OZX63_00850 [Lactobacillus sp. ESL0700]WEV62432.1 hypothetical protein OZX69_00850 [Lactobacillus sp. ESL0731]
MELGSISGWVTAFAEIAAVCVALFLPYYENNQERNKRSRNLRLIFKAFIKDALEEDDTKKLESYFKISYLINDNEDDEQIFSLIQQAIMVINDHQITAEQKEKEVQEIVDCID